MPGGDPFPVRYGRSLQYNDAKWPANALVTTTGYDTIQAFQKAEIMFAPALQTEGKKLQREQAIGMSR